jgi:hypothetical protein
MLFVLDSNEYLFALGILPKPASQKLLDCLIEAYPTHHVRVPRLIIEEVRRHLSNEAFRELLNAIRLLTTIDEGHLCSSSRTRKLSPGSNGILRARSNPRDRPANRPSVVW